MANDLDEETDLRAIEARFLRRQKSDSIPYPKFSNFQYFSRVEREYWIGRLLCDHFGDLYNIKLLEVGAGSGANIYGFFNLGVRPQNYTANELVPSLAEETAMILPRDQVFTGDARSLPGNLQFDVVYASTVFSSIASRELASSLATAMWRLTKPGGVVLWYDLNFNNPQNPDVRGIGRAEIQSLFPDAAKISSRRITLAPPIGRRVGGLYQWFNLPFLRSHLIATVHKSGV